jgi:hypothetical protein
MRPYVEATETGYCRRIASCGVKWGQVYFLAIGSGKWGAKWGPKWGQVYFLAIVTEVC